MSRCQRLQWWLFSSNRQILTNWVICLAQAWALNGMEVLRRRSDTFFSSEMFNSVQTLECKPNCQFLDTFPTSIQNFLLCLFRWCSVFCSVSDKSRTNFKVLVPDSQTLTPRQLSVHKPEQNFFLLSFVSTNLSRKQALKAWRYDSCLQIWNKQTLTDCQLGPITNPLYVKTLILHRRRCDQI